MCSLRKWKILSHNVICPCNVCKEDGNVGGIGDTNTLTEIFKHGEIPDLKGCSGDTSTRVRVLKAIAITLNCYTKA